MEFILQRILNLLITYVFVITGDDRSVIVRHPEVFKHLHRLFYDYPESARKPIAAIHYKVLKEVCKASVRSAFIASDELVYFDSETNEISTTDADIKVNFRDSGPDLIENRFSIEPTKSDVISLMIPVPSGDQPTLALAFQCFQSQSYHYSILDLQDDHYYVVRQNHKPFKREYYRPLGRLVPLAKPDVETVNRPAALAVSFLKSAAKLSEGTTYVRDICVLTPLKHIETCAATFKSFEPQEYERSDWHRMGDYVRNSCVTNAFVLLPQHDRHSEPESYKIGGGIGLLPCAINRAWSSPQYYIMADQLEKESVFILRVTETERDGDPVYALTMRLVYVTTLRHVF